MSASAKAGTFSSYFVPPGPSASQTPNLLPQTIAEAPSKNVTLEAEISKAEPALQPAIVPLTRSNSDPSKKKKHSTIPLCGCFMAPNVDDEAGASPNVTLSTEVSHKSDPSTSIKSHSTQSYPDGSRNGSMVRCSDLLCANPLAAQLPYFMLVEGSRDRHYVNSKTIVYFVCFQNHENNALEMITSFRSTAPGMFDKRNGLLFDWLASSRFGRV